MKKLTLLLVSILLVVGSVWRMAQANPQTGFIIDRADAVRTIETTRSDPLNALLNAVAPRIVMQYANGLRHVPLANVPTAFNTLLNNVQPRVVVQYANSLRHIPLTNVPTAFNSLLNDVQPRFVVQYANGMRHTPLLYPRDLIGDTTPPQITVPPQAVVGANRVVTIRWTTDEWARGQVLYGASPGNYAHTAGSELYQLNHEVILADLPYGVYYWRTRSEDLSGNSTLSAEQSFTIAADTTPPVLSNISLNVLPSNRIRGTWTTNEPSTSQLVWGLTPGNYPFIVESSTLATSHTLTTPVLAPGTYYVRVRSADVAGNQAQSAEQRVVVPFRMYIPIVRK